MKKTFGVAKGFIIGSMVGGAICMMVEPPSTAKIRKVYRKTNRAMKTVGSAIEDLVSCR